MVATDLSLANLLAVHFDLIGRTSVATFARKVIVITCLGRFLYNNTGIEYKLMILVYSRLQTKDEIILSSLGSKTNTIKIIKTKRKSLWLVLGNRLFVNNMFHLIIHLLSRLILEAQYTVYINTVYNTPKTYGKESTVVSLSDCTQQETSQE